MTSPVIEITPFSAASFHGGPSVRASCEVLTSRGQHPGFGRPLIDHVKYRINADLHALPPKFLVVDFDGFVAFLEGTPAHKLECEGYGVQPGVSERDIDVRLADSMAFFFALEYVRRGGDARAAQLIGM